MESIINHNPLLKQEIDKVAEVAGYLWQKGWAERNGGNIVVNVTEQINSQLPTDNCQLITANCQLSNPIPIGTTLPHLKGCYFYCKGTNRRMRDLAR